MPKMVTYRMQQKTRLRNCRCFRWPLGGAVGLVVVVVVVVVVVALVVAVVLLIITCVRARACSCLRPRGGGRGGTSKDACNGARMQSPSGSGCKTRGRRGCETLGRATLWMQDPGTLVVVRRLGWAARAPATVPETRSPPPIHQTPPASHALRARPAMGVWWERGSAWAFHPLGQGWGMKRRTGGGQTSLLQTSL